MDAITLALLKALGGGNGGYGLPPTGPASVGDVLSLDNNKKPQWAAPSGGGGVLVVHATASDDALVLDKTWQDIYDADAVSIVWADEDDAKIHLNCSQVAAKPQLGGGGIVYSVIAASGGDVYYFETSSATGYPSYTFD